MSRVRYAAFGEARDTVEEIERLLREAAAAERAAAAARSRRHKTEALELMAEARALRVRARHLHIQHHRRLRHEETRAARGGGEPARRAGGDGHLHA